MLSVEMSFFLYSLICLGPNIKNCTYLTCIRVDGASSDGMVRRTGSDEGGDGKADADVGVIVGSGQRCGKGRGKKSCRLERRFSILPQY